LSEDSLEEKALALIKSRPNGVLQSDLWKDLDIDSRKCSRVIAKLEEDGKIKRTRETVKGTRTYRISYLPQKKEAPKKEVDFSLIMVNGNIAPCIGCTYECEPDYCPDLGNWIEMLTRMPEQPVVKPLPKPKVEKVEAPVEELAPPVKVKKGKAPSKAPEKVPEMVPEKAPEKVSKKAPVKVSKPAKAAKPSKVEKPVEEEKPAKASARKTTLGSKKVAIEAVAPSKPAPKARPTTKARSAKKK
jgi:hypothetical protein